MEDEDELDVIPVTCGSVTAYLHRQLFICPGIRQACIEVDGKFVTPKDFTFIGNKHTLKDWKTAIRINGVSLRKMMDTGELDFYNHTEQCTGRCVARSLANIKVETVVTNNDDTSLEYDLGTSSINTSLSEHSYTVLQQVKEADHIKLPKLIQKPGPRLSKIGQIDTATIPESLVIKQEPQDQEDNSMDLDALGFATAQAHSTPSSSLTYIIAPSSTLNKKTTSKYDLPKVPNGETDFEKLAKSFPDVDDLVDESQTFWQSILKLGMMDIVMREINLALDQMRIKLIRGNVGKQDAQRLSKAITHLGLTQTLKVRLAEHKTTMLRQDIKLQMEIKELKRKLADSERKQEENKVKSKAFESLIEMGKGPDAKKQKLAKDMEYDPEQDSDEGSD